MELFSGRCNVSPLILTLIFITFFHNVLSRHRIRHYKDRFKRQQGANLYLPGTYITEGGEGPDIGPWSEWSEPSPCSRTCGGGVSTQHRTCSTGYTCQGPDKRHFSCNTQDCPDLANYREQQCAEYNNIPFEGVYYQWVPYTKAPNPCELNCMPKGERFYFRHASSVVDGTRCNDENLDVCVNGKCQPVGCDMMLGSSAREDLCRVCGGNGSTCNTIENVFPMKDMQVGYNDILLIPAGATNIKVEEVGPSNNYLAVRNTSGHYYLNGNWRIDFPRTLEFAGCKFHYERTPQAFPAPDIITCLGPTDEPLFIVVLYQNADVLGDVPVKYTYSVPTNIVGTESETYAWIFDEFTPCSQTCGGGLQYRNVTCAGRKTLEPVDRNLCNADNEPESQRKCNEVACDAQWIPQVWGECSAPCGEGGVQTREVSCQQILGSGYPALAEESECLKHHPKPPNQQKCNEGKVCAKWHTGPWKPCDHLCGEGNQTRKVTCYIKNEENKIEVLDQDECAAIEPKPEETKACNVRPCEGVDWITSEWSGCDRICGLTNETRKVHCATSKGKIYADDLCEAEHKPKTIRKCESSNTTCQYLWYSSEWSECSVECGEGIQTRTIFCGVSTVDGVKKVENDKCDASKNFETIQKCTGEQEECEGEWFSGPWGSCTKPCGGGDRYKKVVCVKDGAVVDPPLCGVNNIAFGSESCNTHPCSEDTIIPTDVTQSIDESETGKTKVTPGVTIAETTAEPDETAQSDTGGEVEITTQPSVTTSDDDDDEYELVSDTECEDGEWVYVDDGKEVTPKLGSEQYKATSTESPFSLDDLMLSDGTPSSDGLDTLETGSGEGITSPITETQKDTDEGSGTEPTFITDTDTEISYIPSTKLDSSELTSDTAASVSEVSGVTNPVTDVTTENSGSEVTTISSVSEMTSSKDASTDVSDSGNTETRSDITTESGSDITTEAGSDATTEPISTNMSDSDVTEVSNIDLTTGSSEETTVSGSSESSSITETSDITVSTEYSSTTESTETTESTSPSVSYDTETSIITGSDETSVTEFSSSTADVITTTDSESSSSTTEEPGVILEYAGLPDSTTIDFTESSESSATTTEFNGSTETTSTDSTEADGSSVSGSSEATTEFSASPDTTTEFTGSTEAEGSTVITADVSEQSTTEYTGTTQSVEVTTQFTGSSESSTELTTETIKAVTGSSETTEFTGSTVETSEPTATESDIFESSSISEPSEETTLGTTILDIFLKKPKMCKRRKVRACSKSQYGCCWDNITPAEGPFDAGCPIPKTCKESKYACCDDGVSAALGPKKAGCPSSHCNETLFGCCSDNKTIAEGNNNEGCPPPPPECLKSKYGCCKDNVTEAKGPTGKGCEEEDKPDEEATTMWSETKETETETEIPGTEGPAVTEDCNNTTYRCCPDNVTAAAGPGFQGCNLPCSDTTFACCPDGATPAHGPSGEGCCLSGAYGCCPDNILPARGPNLEGCGCQYAPYGCCPDNVTYARGYNREGCGCQHTEYGCCPDSFTPANGPDYEGCLCHTFQFGCCPDGITAARGPHQQGCGCRNTEFGCCSDEESPALGPNMEGCGCVSSKFGCCLDGVTTAKGDNFEGCDAAPANLQASCSLPKERGNCRNYTVKWYFDMDYAGCSRFWYGGCDGNGNRFRTKEECEGVCVEPTGPETCNLPKITGPCEGYYPHWFYDTDLNHCIQFIYGGCLGNKNRFETREECMNLCVKDKNIDACEQPKEEGPCKGRYERYYYNKEDGTCRPFLYGGCKGNNNNFQTSEACQQKCTAPFRKKDHCSLPRAQGNCTERLPKWYYDTPEKRCMPFYYSGCGSNLNNFNSKEECETDCPLEIVKDTCQLPAETGECANYVDHWYFDTREKVCRQFYYGGCGGNENNFETQQKCQQRCEHRAPEPSSPIDQPVPTASAPEQFSTEMCFIPSDPGPCRAVQVKYYYDRTDGVCKSFHYGGCEGNRNRFNSMEECLQYCGAAQDLCTLPPVVGSCNGEYSQYYYEPTSDSCLLFNYGGCGGNYNRFHDRSSCEQRCKKAHPTVSAEVLPVPPSDLTMCYQPVDAGNCSDNNVAFFYNKESGTCSPFTYTGCGGNDNRFTSEEQCQRQCGAFREQDVCNMERDPGPCRGYFLKYYFDKSTGRCEQFAFGGCQGNGNRFSSKEECERICVTHDEPIPPNITKTAICQLPADPGPCQDSYHRRWYFDDQRGECLAFIYTGCGGNFNNFKTYQYCLDFCKDLLPATEPPIPAETRLPHPCQEVFDECSNLRCPYGVEAYIDENDCNRCQCRDPCRGVYCLEDEQCAIDINRNKTTSSDADFIAICRKSNKPGTCPVLEPSEINCEQECRTDADCTLHLKCCSTGCGTACVDPTHPPEFVTDSPGYTVKPAEIGFQPPQVDPDVYEPEVSALIGDQAILKCAVNGNPNPRITWSKGNIEIDGTQPRYRIKLDQSLQIITLHKTDSGIYLCTADNSIGDPITNEIKLEVVDSEPRAVSILDQQEVAPVVVSLNAPTTLNCYALGWPYPTVTWWKDDSLIPLKNNEFEVRKDYSLLIHSVQLHNLGVYTCQAYNGLGKAASWAVTVKAIGPYYFTDPEELKYKPYIVNPPEDPTTTTTPQPSPPMWPQPPPLRPTFAPWIPPAYNEPEPPNEIIPDTIPPPVAEGGVVPPLQIVPVRANITVNDQRYPVGSTIELPCHVIGYPEPQVNWYKDGTPIYPSERLLISDAHTLTILQATKDDSGIYQCEATNAYSTASSSLELFIEGMYIHPNCKDNQLFANCALIVRAKYCSHKYYAKFCCKSCTEAGLLPVDGPHLDDYNKRTVLSTNLV